MILLRSTKTCSNHLKGIIDMKQEIQDTINQLSQQVIKFAQEQSSIISDKDANFEQRFEALCELSNVEGYFFEAKQADPNFLFFERPFAVYQLFQLVSTKCNSNVDIDNLMLAF